MNGKSDYKAHYWNGLIRHIRSAVPKFFFLRKRIMSSLTRESYEKSLNVPSDPPGELSGALLLWKRVFSGFVEEHFCRSCVLIPEERFIRNGV